MVNLKKHFSIQQDKRLPTIWSVLCFGIGILIFYLVYLNYINLPTAFSIEDEPNNPGEFIAERAKNDLRNLTSRGPRVGGSPANEVYAVDFLLTTAGDIQRDAHPSQLIEIDHAIVDGGFLHPNVNVYRGVQNVVVKISSRSGTTSSSLMLNAHFDSVPTSPGGGDDGTMTVIMLEILRTLSKQATPLKHSIIFVFNGCEENELQGSHAFITQHKWAAEVKAFINMDVAGNGGREILFQAGPQHPWLMNYYRKTAKHPYTTVMAEELFQAGLLPSITDYGNFVKYGNIPGMDFAHIYNGHVYHTMYDRYETIPLESFQNTGNNILALTIAIGNSNELGDTKADSEGQAVFFDFLGWFLVYYRTGVEISVNVIVMVLGTIGVSYSIYEIMKVNSHSLDVLFEFGMSIIVQTITTVVGAGLALLFTIIINGVERPMAWFSEPWLIFGLYICPFLVGCCGSIFYLRFRKVRTITTCHRVQLFLHAQCVMLVIILIALTASRIRTAYLVMIPILFYSVPVIINAATKLQNKGHKWLILHFIGQFVPFIYFSSLIITAFVVFIPVSGNQHGEANPEIMVAVLSVLMTMLMCGFLVPLIGLFRRPLLLVAGLGAMMVLTWILVATPVGFPYRAETSPQRHFVSHIKSIFHNVDGSVRKVKTGYYMEPMDLNSDKVIAEYISQYDQRVDMAEECERELYCGIPYYLEQEFIRTHISTWIPAPEPVFEIPTLLALENTQSISPTRTRFSFRMSGPSHMTITISPLENRALAAWSFNAGFEPEERWKNRNVYVAAYFAGSNIFTPYFFTVDIDRIAGSTTSNSFDIGLSGHYVYQTEDRTPEFVRFVSQFPDFAQVTSWPALYQQWTF